MAYHIWLRGQDQWQPQRGLPQQERLEAQAEPELVRQ